MNAALEWARKTLRFALRADTPVGPHAEFEAEIDRIALLEAAVAFVLKTFRDSERAGYRSRERQFAIDILSMARTKPAALVDIEHAVFDARIREALSFAAQHGSTDGAHHKQWIIDQMVRSLTGTPEAYERFVAEARKGEDGPQTYFWDTGIAP